MPEDNPSPSRTDPISVMQEQMHSYLNSYQDAFRSAMDNFTALQITQDYWRRQMDFAGKLLEASHMVVKATSDYVQDCTSQAAAGWQKTVQVVTDEALKQQDRTKTG